MVRIDFYRHFGSTRACGSPFERTLQELGIDYRIFAPGIWDKHQSRLYLWFVVWLRLLVFGWAAVFRSLFRTPRPEIVVAWTHLVLLPLAVLKVLSPRKTPQLVLVGFIYTPRSSHILHYFRQRYFRWLLARLSLVLVYSQFEAETYASLFHLPRERFAFVPLGGNIARIPEARGGERCVFSAGRSSRDYELLFRAASRLPYPFRIACNLLNSKGCPPNVTILDDCWHGAYLQEIASSSLVVIPLKDHDLSAGQMTLLDSMALGKPIIITRTPTTMEYVKHGKNAFLIGPEDEDALCQAIELLLTNNDFAQELGAEAREAYRAEFSEETSTRRMLGQLIKLVE